jgi:hypothetical protein
MKSALVAIIYLTVLAQCVCAVIVFQQWKRGTEVDLEQFKTIVVPTNVTSALISWQNSRGEAQSKDLPIHSILSILNTVSETSCLDVQKGSYSKEVFVATVFVKWSNKENTFISLEVASGGRIFLSYLIQGKPTSGNLGFLNLKLVDAVRAIVNELNVPSSTRKGNQIVAWDVTDNTNSDQTTVR